LGYIGWNRRYFEPPEARTFTSENQMRPRPQSTKWMASATGVRSQQSTQ